MEIRVNGQPHRTQGATLAELLAEHAIEPGRPGVAVAINAAVVPRREWQNRRLSEGDEVEIVKPHSGG